MSSPLIADLQYIFEACKDLPDEVAQHFLAVLDKLATQYMEISAERAIAVEALKTAQGKHEEMYLFLVAMLRKFDGYLLIEREHYPVLDFREYILEWEDCPEEGGVKATLRHFSEEGGDGSSK